MPPESIGGSEAESSSTLPLPFRSVPPPKGSATLAGLAGGSPSALFLPCWSSNKVGCRTLLELPLAPSKPEPPGSACLASTPPGRCSIGEAVPVSPSPGLCLPLSLPNERPGSSAFCAHVSPRPSSEAPLAPSVPGPTLAPQEVPGRSSPQLLPTPASPGLSGPGINRVASSPLSSRAAPSSPAARFDAPPTWSSIPRANPGFPPPLSSVPALTTLSSSSTGVSAADELSPTCPSSSLKHSVHSGRCTGPFFRRAGFGAGGFGARRGGAVETLFRQIPFTFRQEPSSAGTSAGFRSDGGLPNGFPVRRRANLGSWGLL